MAFESQVLSPATCNVNITCRWVPPCLWLTCLLFMPQVYGLPTLMIFKDGQEVPGTKTEGAVTKAMLVKYLKKHAVTEVPAM